MEYQPFLDMHLLVSNELLEAIPILFNAFLQLVLGIVLTIGGFKLLKNYLNKDTYLKQIIFTACSCRSRVRQGCRLDKQANDCGQVHSQRQYE